MTLHLLQSAIGSYIRMHDPKYVLNPHVRKHLEHTMTMLVHDMTEKFIKGQLEHGGDIRDRNLKKELRNEIIDLLFYSAAQDWKDDLVDVIDKRIKERN
jgi:hypothetical protein